MLGAKAASRGRCRPARGAVTAGGLEALLLRKETAEPATPFLSRTRSAPTVGLEYF